MWTGRVAPVFIGVTLPSHWSDGTGQSTQGDVEHCAGKLHVYKYKWVHTPNTSVYSRLSTWLVPSKPLVNPPEERLLVNSWPPRLQENLLPPPVESRSPTDTGPELSLSVRSEGTRSPLSSSSASCPSSVLSEKSPRTSRLTLGSRALPSWPSRRPARLTSSVFSRTPTCAPSTPRGSPSCPRTSSWPEESEESVHKHLYFCTICTNTQPALFRATNKYQKRD